LAHAEAAFLKHFGEVDAHIRIGKEARSARSG
jgi:hypothetical protein